MKRNKVPDMITSEKLATGFGQRLEWGTIILLFPISLLLTFHATGSGGALEPLMLPLCLAIAVGAGLRFRMTGTIVIMAILLPLLAYAWWSGSGMYAEGEFGEHLLFTVGCVALFGSTTFLSGVVVGYHLRSADLADEREHLMHRVLDSLPIGVWVRARDGGTVFINERWASFSNLTVSQVMGSASQEAPVNLGDEWEAERQALLDSEDSSIRYQHVDLVDNSGRSCSMTLLTLRVYIDEGQGVGTLSLLVDETALRFYETQLKDSEHRLRMALDTVKMGFWEKNLQTGEIFRDANWSRILHVDTVDRKADSKDWHVRIHPDERDRVLSAYSQFLESNSELLEIDYRIRRGAREYIWVQDRVTVLDRDVVGRAKRIMGTMQDISASKRIELDLKQAKERAEAGNRAKGHFIATISHEIRTPLNAIIGLSSFLKESDLDEEQMDLTQTIYSSGKSLLLLVNDILDFSKIEAGRLDMETEEFPLGLCFEDCVKLFKARAEERDVALKLSMDPSLPEFALGDMERLRQVVQNLLANALKFTDEGEVTIEVVSVSLDELPVERRPDDLKRIGFLDDVSHDYLEVRVRDTGIGIPEDRQHVLFEAFSQVDPSTTRKYGGTGLGLAICKRLVLAMGGQMWVESSEGNGSVFGFVIRTRFMSEEFSGGGAHVSISKPSERIVEQYPCGMLIVGPREAVSPLMRVCRQFGYAPHHASEYDLSAESYQRRRYDLVFIWLGDESGALALSRQMFRSPGATHPRVVIGVVPEGVSVSKKRCKLVGMQRLIEEPVRQETIREVILDALRRHD